MKETDNLSMPVNERWLTNKKWRNNVKTIVVTNNIIQSRSFYYC